jgi:hypothetical protein
MAREQSGSATLSDEERAAGKRAGRKRLGRDGCPKDPTAGDLREAANRTKMTVAHSPEPTPHETKRAMDGE